MGLAESCVLLEGAGGNAAAAVGGRDHIVGAGCAGDGDALVCHLGTVAAHASLTAIKERRGGGVLCVAVPVPVLVTVRISFKQKLTWTTHRLVSLVAALCAQGVLVMPDVVAMPWQEVGLDGVSRYHQGYSWSLTEPWFLGVC